MPSLTQPTASIDAATGKKCERSKVEQILFEISYGEGEFAEAREHLQNAISADGLNPQEVSAALVQIRLVDAKLAADPTGLLPFPTFP